MEMAKVGDKVRIEYMEGEPQYAGKEGVVTSINEDPWGDAQIHGTWGCTSTCGVRTDVQV